MTRIPRFQQDPDPEANAEGMARYLDMLCDAIEDVRDANLQSVDHVAGLIAKLTEIVTDTRRELFALRTVADTALKQVTALEPQQVALAEAFNDLKSTIDAHELLIQRALRQLADMRQNGEDND